jgi:hypothetical protein
MPNDDPPPLSPNVVNVLSKLADEFERWLTPMVDASFEGLAEVAFVQGTLGAHEVRDAVFPESTGHHLHVCLNVLGPQLRGTVTVELLTADGTILHTESVGVNLPSEETMPPRRRPRPLGIINLLVAVPAEVDWGAVVAARVSWAPAW